MEIYNIFLINKVIVNIFDTQLLI